MCRMNSVRSPTAEALARSMLPSDVFVASAGVRPGEHDPFVDAALAEVGLALPGHQPRALAELEDSYFDLIVTLAPEAHHAALELTRSMAVQVEYWPTTDPTAIQGTREQIMEAYRDMRERLAANIRERLVKPGKDLT
ncbi:MAG: low molecular weight phosphatase family protein [Methylobacterium mesophilicum]|nr:low molecular weight phosphatase family protein [Methylobacterium mesophilicum]